MIVKIGPTLEGLEANKSVEEMLEYLDNDGNDIIALVLFGDAPTIFRMSNFSFAFKAISFVSVEQVGSNTVEVITITMEELDGSDAVGVSTVTLTGDADQGGDNDIDIS